MCEQCEAQFDVMTERFDVVLKQYLDMQGTNEVRDTPGERVHDLAFTHQFLCKSEVGKVAVSWYLAIALERLAALESSGITT